MEEKNQVILNYYGGSFFTFHEDDQQGFNEVPIFTHQTNLQEVSDHSHSDNGVMFPQITLTDYSTSANHLNLPTSFVNSGMNLRLKNVILEVEGGRSWKCGLYRAESRPREARLSSGWKDFCFELRLKPEDHLSFKVQERWKNRFFVHIDRV